jgi:HK97 family phage portal protein
MLTKALVKREPEQQQERRAWYSILEQIGVGTETASGVAVNQDTALKLSAVYACVRVLAETVASLPLHVYQRIERGKDRAPNHPLYDILHSAPNPVMTSFQFRETLMGHLALWGNAYAEIQYGNNGQVQALWPLRPDSMTEVKRVDNRLVYRYTMPNGEQVFLPGEKVWHIPGLSSDGINGYSPVSLMRQNIGLGMATEEFGARFFGNDARPGGVLQHPGILGEEAFDRLQGSWESRHGGLSNSHRVAILEEGMTYDQIGIPPEDAQFLETRKFQVTEIARAFRIPPHMLADLERATFSNVEQQSIEFVTHTMRPWLVRWEQSIQQQLMLERDRERYFAEFLVDGLLRGDTQSRYAAYAVARQNGWMSANDIRELENQNPIDNGDIYLVPLNMVPADMAGEVEPSGPATDVARGANRAEGRALPEKRARATAAKRQRLMADYLPLFRDIMGRIVRREVADVKRLAKKHLGKDDMAGFLLWLDDFYGDDHREFVEKNMAPGYQAYAAAVMRAVVAEVDSDDELEPGAFVDSYNESYAARYTAKQRKQLNEVIQRAQRDDDDVLLAVENRMDDWDAVRPEQEARRETHRSGNAIALFTMGVLGVMTKRWVTLGDSCPYCTQLDGRTISTTQYFLQNGESLQGGERGPLTVSGNIGHPPAHDGCDCMVIVG